MKSSGVLVDAKEQILSTAREHPCASHPFFQTVEQAQLSANNSARLLRNYDAHASALRRLLLKAATLMPEPAVGFILENVRNEYGNGSYENNHQFQLLDVAIAAGATTQMLSAVKIQPGIKTFIKEASSFYYPRAAGKPRHFLTAAVAAGAITATEILAINEFRSLQIAFTPLGLTNHVWFDHVAIEAEHTDESLALALYFIEHHQAADAVLFGLTGVLDANIHLYDGLLSSLH